MVRHLATFAIDSNIYASESGLRYFEGVARQFHESAFTDITLVSVLKAAL
jgi:hypothetical protein